MILNSDAAQEPGKILYRVAHAVKRQYKTTLLTRRCITVGIENSCQTNICAMTINTVSPEKKKKKGVYYIINKLLITSLARFD